MHKNPFAYSEFAWSCAVEYPADVKVGEFSIPASSVLRV